MTNKNMQTLLSKEQIDSVISLYSSGDINQAIQRIKTLNQEYPNVPLLFNILGACYKVLGDTEAALQMFDTATKIKPNYAEVHFNIGVIYQELGQLESAIDSYKKAINIIPKYPDAHNNLGIVYLDSNNLDNALNCFKSAISYKPDFAEAHNNLGSTLQQKGKLEEAIKSYKRSISFKSNFSQAHNNIGIIYQKLGDNKSAIMSYESAIKFDPSYAFAHLNLSAIKKFSESDTQIAQIKSALFLSNATQSNKVHLFFALAKVSEDLGKTDELFEYLDNANKLRKNELNFSYDKSDDHNLIVKNFFQTFLPTNNKPQYKAPVKNLIFIVGMPRSGTSLAEQIISNHPQVYGGGEMKNLTEILLPFFDVNPNIGKTNMTEDALYSIGQQYLESLSDLDATENFITDKWPLNFRNIGFILSAFPDAKIVHLERDPIATCWSIYKTYFSDNANGWAYNFDDIAEFYSSYKDLMVFWHKLYPNKIYDLCYEDLTIDQENETRKLIQYLNLDWDKSCLNFHTNKRAVDTASSLQVRQKMYQGSSDVWKKYKSYLKPLIKKLD